MAQFVIQGGKSLNGEVAVYGAKNAALKMIAASILTDQVVVIRNVPDILDIRSMVHILKKLGADIEFKDHIVRIECRDIKSSEPDYQLVKHMRGSVVVIGPLLARFRQTKIPQPGGCLIGARPIDTHIKAFTQLGVRVTQDKDYYYFSADRLHGSRVVLDEMSVTATENIMMAAVCAVGTTEIHLAAAEPEIFDLANLLNKMGARIRGAGTNIITIEGVRALKGADHTVIPDRIEAGTFAIAAAVSRGDVRIQNIIPDHLDAVLQQFRHANVSYEIENGSTLHVKPTTIFHPIRIETRPYPGYPTDLQAPISVLLTQASGTSTIFETMYEGRLGYVSELEKMGATITKIDSHVISIAGPTPLYGTKITSFDIRAGATLIIAALIAQGESTIERVELVDRGYEGIEQRLQNLGASIKRIE
ncbi:MAG: UDP-N-acetylglucosamine 1-carboxyvinyltransferase [Patescibacteria group bacterium]|nr:UDP-N-acetylglucosamine 1-carboxyvinyltransferase [Patescibacteria group bacterium]MDD5715118.1 UDP-N-acetylglucosamine 1-carboxyvinyltransferase [Patescibacteria group bacterium]